MTTTLSAHGGGAQPARIDTSGKVTGGAAMRVYGFDSEAAALAAGYVCEGGPAMSVVLITDAQLASGDWKLDGDPFAVVIYTAPDSLPTEGGFAVPVYAVNGWGGAPVPSGPVLLLDLEADMLALNDGDPVSTWADQSGNGNDFTQTGSARPIKQTVGSFPAVVFDGIDDWMQGQNIADNLSSFSLFIVASIDANNSNSFITISKIGVINGNGDYDIGWIEIFGSISLIQQYSPLVNSGCNNPDSSTSNKMLITEQVDSLSNLSTYINGNNDDSVLTSTGATNYSNSHPLTLAAETNGLFFSLINLYAIRIYAPALSSTDRAAVEAELATRYGITL